MTDFARQERCIHPEVGIMTGLGGEPNRWFCGQCNFEFSPLPSLGTPLAYCGQDGCRDSISQAVLIGRQQSSEQKSAEANAATEIATEPNEIRVCGKHIVSFAGNEPCGICGGSAETGGEKAASPDYKAAYDELRDGINTAVEMISEFAEPFDSGGEPEYSHQDVEYNAHTSDGRKLSASDIRQQWCPARNFWQA